MFKLNYSKYNPRDLFSGGGLYMEGGFHFKSWFLNAPGLIHGGAYYRNFTVVDYTNTELCVGSKIES